LEDFARPISGAIVHDDQLRFDPALCEQVANCLFDPRFFITRRHDHRTSEDMLRR
jgi:hypothetical protein